MANLISNLIKKFEFEPNFNLVELELEPEPCDIDYYCCSLLSRAH